MTQSLLDDLLARLGTMPEAERKAIEEEAYAATAQKPFIPSPGAQTDAYFSQADILLYGGEPGGGKTGLLIGLALNEHDRSLIVRKQFTDLEGVIDNAKEMVGSEQGFVGGTRPKYKMPDGRVIHFEGMSQGEGVDTGKQGTPHDFIGVDEGAQLPENAIRMLLGWNRTKKPGQRCRMVIASNPPLNSVGDWMVDFFGPWLNENHPNPAKPGELRWFIINEKGVSEEVDGPEPIEREAKTYEPHSRTFIPAGLKDNPFIDAADYQKRLQAMPEPYRTLLTSGNFMLARKDDDWQCIPTAWVQAAMARWTETPPQGVPMCAMGADPSGGGKDETTLTWRHDGWYAPIFAVPGEKTPGGRDVAGLIVANRRDQAAVVIDMGGGYGGVPYKTLKDNDIGVMPFKGAEATTARTSDKQFGFVNKRSEAYWKFREALDPDQPGGSPIALPPDPKLKSDLTAPTYEVTARGIKLEPKEDVVAKLNRSPDRGDAVVMTWMVGLKALNGTLNSRSGRANNTPKVVMGHQTQRRKR